jgi:hypothetical protein
MRRQGRHAEQNEISELNGWPAFSPVNASPTMLPPPAHDSGPGWIANPFLYGSFIRNSLPVFTDAFPLSHLPFFPSLPHSALLRDLRLGPGGLSQGRQSKKTRTQKSQIILCHPSFPQPLAPQHLKRHNPPFPPPWNPAWPIRSGILRTRTSVSTSPTARTAMIAPHIAHEPHRRPRTGKSARPGCTCAGAWIASKSEIGDFVDQQSSPPRAARIGNSELC